MSTLSIWNSMTLQFEPVAQILDCHIDLSTPAKEKPMTFASDPYLKPNWRDTPTHDHDDIRLCTACSTSPAKEETPMPSTICLRDDPENKRLILTDPAGRDHSYQGVILWRGLAANVGAIGFEDASPFLQASYETKTGDHSAASFAFAPEDQATLQGVVKQLEDRNANQFNQIMELRAEVADLKHQTQRLLDDNIALSEALIDTVEVTTRALDIEVQAEGSEPLLISTSRSVDETDDGGEPLEVSYKIGATTVTATYYEVRK